jgi:UDP-glucose 4-epimerase
VEAIKQVVVLGHSGFIGQHLMRSIGAQYPHLTLTGRSHSDLDLTKPTNAREVADLFQPDTAVVMLSGIKRQFGDNLEIFRDNLSMVENVCRVLTDQRPARFVYFSSTAVYGEDIHNTWITEMTSPYPTSYYGLAKFTSERLLANVYGEDAKPQLLVLRPPLIYGPGDPAETYGPVGFAKKAVRGEEIVTWGDGTELREFLYVRDAVDLTMRLVNSSVSGVLNLVSGESRSFRDILEITKEYEVDLRVCERDRSKDRVDHVFDPSLLLSNAEGFEFTTLRSGIEYTIESLR